jgi:hypothetical protein
MGGRCYHCCHVCGMCHCHVRLDIRHSDRDKGLMEALPNVLPRCTFSWCCHHLAANVSHRQGAGGARSGTAFWSIAKSITPQQYAQRLLALRDANAKAYNYVVSLPRERYCNAFFPIPRFGAMTSNLVESINSSFREIRRRPIVAMIEGIYDWMATKRYERSTVTNSTTLTPNAFAILTSLQKDASYTVVASAQGIATVTGINGNQFLVNLSQKRCSCGLFHDFQFPCTHALKLITMQRLQVLDYVHPCYLAESYMLAYGTIVPPVQLRRVGEGAAADACLPLVVVRGRGRPRTKRRSAGVY